jgi:hypothetical protein
MIKMNIQAPTGSGIARFVASLVFKRNMFSAMPPPVTIVIPAGRLTAQWKSVLPTAAVLTVEQWRALPKPVDGLIIVSEMPDTIQRLRVMMDVDSQANDSWFVNWPDDTIKKAATIRRL